MGDALTRRHIAKLIGWTVAACGLQVRAKAANEETTLEIDRLWDRTCPASLTERTYRVDATVLLLSMPVLRRSGVGDARVALRQLHSAPESCMALEFAASSDPARAHGLDRMGWIREVVIEKHGAPQRAGVLGIMSDSPEQTADAARTALKSNAAEQALIAIDSSHSGGGEPRTRSRVMRFRAPRAQWICEQSAANEALPNLARQSFQASATEWKDATWPGEGSAPTTFLYALKRAMEQGGSRRTEYIWNQDRYQMRLVRQADDEQSRRYSTPVDCVCGEVQNITRSLSATRFRIWIGRESSVPMPFRIEFQPRSFLRLTLEAVDHH